MSAPPFKRPELVFAVVGAAGARLDRLIDELTAALRSFSYTCVDIRLSDLLPGFYKWSPQKEAGEYHRIRHLQEVGNAFREELGDGAALARAALAAIQEKRSHINRGDQTTPAFGHAFIL